MMGNSEVIHADSYAPDTIAIDTQALVNGRAPKVQLIEMNISMTRQADDRAPQKLGSRLTDVKVVPIKDEESIIASQLSVKQQYELRRQMRNKNYTKRWKAYLEEENGSYEEADLQSGNDEKCEDEHEHATNTVRNPSRYLTALLRHDPDRQELIELFYHTKSPQIGACVETLQRMANPGKKRATYRGVDPPESERCSHCKTELNMQRPERLNAHLLNCTRQSRIKAQTQHIKAHFESSLRNCRWNDCGHSFRSQSAGTYSLHVTRHLESNRLQQCLWERCGFTAACYEDLALHVGIKHDVPTEWTTTTRRHYCYEHNFWLVSDQAWSDHLRQHLEDLNDFCGLIRNNGLIIVAAQCLFCLGDVNAPPHVRCAQYPDIFMLHKHMKSHLEHNTQLDTCPHPRCDDSLGSHEAFWQHATDIHGIPPFGPRRLKRKRSDTLEENDCVIESDLGAIKSQ
ncbi:unnamed protein product [Periconia digitata]|uniref:C2H2-type domain-containing protein n=1 Tax=Periconia digitata TaxID=1303443 RepID=A0A9W4UJ88_9PLEO|nr:unnamed protein product [Periconia digitata]